jgi:Uma2 family endonuclease
MGGMADAAPKLMTVAEFLAWDDGTDTRYELVYGRPMAMAPALEAHQTIVGNIVAAAQRRLKPPCRVAPNIGVQRAEWHDRFYEPDVAITCSPPVAGARSMPDPVAVFEVLSPSTSARDLAIKLPDYQEMPSVEDIVVVSARQRRVEHWRRDGARWVAQAIVGDGAVALATLGVAIPLAEIYANVALEPREPA